jgi:predicted alpha/beta hydrolase
MMPSIARSPLAPTAVQTIGLLAADGYALTASHFSAPSDQFIVVAAATAVPRWFYAKFAQYAQSRGINVMTTDYRGIGDSKRGSLKGFEMDYADWSRYDLAAAIDYAAQRGKVWLVGHSLGGHAMDGCHGLSATAPGRCGIWQARLPRACMATSR